ncbi:CGNR zinc finger domain-containing protein [Streptosporangium sp. CA-135522]|uniref:CGNR zinc finger domain-containing protein n=1 Tax=Streptosporangium sp. CA-135522 TaxID=3240072 RepID=UPI003D8BE21E
MYSFRFRGGRSCLDFVATVSERRQHGVERLTTPDDLGRWFTEAGLAAPAPPVSEEILRRARRLREALYELFTAHRLGQEVPPGALAAVNGWATRPPRAHRLEVGSGGRLRQVGCETTVETLLAEIARDAVHLLGGPLADRVHECELDRCSSLFLDTSRAGHRRWCSMDGCGARAKMAAYRARRNEETS